MQEVVRRWRAPYAVGLGMLAALRRGRADPTCRRGEDGALWRTTLTPDGAATQRLVVDRDEVVSRSWGPGAEWVAHRLPDLLGARDRLDGFDPARHPVLAELWRRDGELRFPATDRVLESLVPAVLEQRVTGMEARRAWSVLVRGHGTPAPGPAPAGIVVAPSPEQWRAVPSWDWHRAGVERARSDTVARAVRVADRLEECVELGRPAAARRLRTVAGVGVWTAAEVAQRAYADADAVPYGDFHIATNVVFALTGETDGDDDRLAELLAPWEGHRGRVVRLVERAGITRPRRGPRYSPLDFRTR